jgi:hypothetical protein
MILSNLYVLTFINTNIGVVARFKCLRAGRSSFNRIWLREAPGSWRQMHYRSKRDWLVSGEYLEGAYCSVARDGTLKYEDWW